MQFPVLLSPPIAYLLIAHGSRDSRAQKALLQLAARVRTLLAAPVGGGINLGEGPAAGWPPIATATLEFAPQPLPERIVAVARMAGAATVRLVPLFLQAGVHAREDLPAAVRAARRLSGDRIAVELLPPLGAHPDMADSIRGQLAPDPGTHSLLVAHGSQRSGGNAPVVAVANRLDAALAFWTGDPSLEAQVTALAATRVKEIAVVPYFLFPGTIVDAIAARVSRLGAACPELTLTLAAPLSESPALAKLISKLVSDSDYL